MLRKILLYLICLISLESAASNLSLNYDSLLVVAENSNKRKDFTSIDSLLRFEEIEYDTPTSKKLILVASRRTKELKFEFLHGKFKFHESIISTLHGDIGSAMKMVRESLAIFSKYHSLEAARCYNTMGSMIAGQGDTKKGLLYLEKADRITEFFKDEPRYNYMICDNILVTGYIHILAENYDSALYCFEQSLLLGEKIDYNLTISYSYVNFADVYRRQGRFPEALEAAEKAIAISSKENATNLLCIGYYRKGQIFYDMGELDSSLYHYKNAEKAAIKQNLNGRLLNIYRAIAQISKDKGNFVMASDYQERYINLSADVLSKDRDSRLEMMQIRFDVDEKIGQINSLAIQKDLEEEQNKLLTIAVIITIAAFILLVGVVILIFNRLRLNRKIRHERYEKELSIYQMTAMKTQMNPHFMYNALTSIQDLILQEKTDESYSYISKFAHLMRKTLNDSDKEFIDIQEEFDALKLYLQLESLRFQGDLNIDFETNGIDDLMIPPLLIQPFIENAIKHGLLHKKGPKHLRVHFKMKEDLICTISDNGIGRKASGKIQERRSKVHKSFALKSIENRFELLRKIYKKDIGVTYVDLESDTIAKGTTVIISLPFKQIH